MAAPTTDARMNWIVFTAQRSEPQAAVAAEGGQMARPSSHRKKLRKAQECISTRRLHYLGREWLSLACAVAQPSMGGPPCCCSSGHHGCTKMPHVYYGARALGLQWVRVRMGLGTPMTTSHYNHHCYQHHIGGIRFSTCLLEALIFI